MRSVQVSLALQGGGAHGAFTWGVLDRLLDEHWLTFDGVSGTSAGAMNAVMLAEGWRKDGRNGARQQLKVFWEAISSQGLNLLLPENVEHSLTRWWLHTMQYVSPYDINVLDINPLKDLLLKQVDFQSLRLQSPIRLFIAATQVSTGKLTLFTSPELSIDHILASACLPKIHKAVNIDGDYFWDGGFSGNPAVFPLVHECSSKDILIVLLQALNRSQLPVTAESISERMTEMSFQGHFIREMQAISDIRRSGSFGFIPGTTAWRFKQTRAHIIQNQEYLSGLHQSTKFNTRKAFLRALFENGQETADSWLNVHANQLGRSASCDIDAMFGG